MKGLLYFILALVVLAGGISVYWWVADDMTLEEQIEYVKTFVSGSMEGSAASNTAETASKLGKVLKGSFDEAQDVYEHGAEAKYE